MKPQPVPQGAESRIQRYNKRSAALRTARSSWEGHWHDIQQYVSPRSGRWTLGETNQGGKKSQSIINNAATQASKVLAAGMMSGLTSPSRPWFRLMTPSPDLMEVAAVKQWLYVVETRLRETLARSNFYQCLPNIYRELGDYGTAAMVCEPDAQQVVRFYPMTVGTYWLATDDRRDVDTLYRELEMTVRQVVGKFGYENVSPRIQSAWDGARYEQNVFVYHMIAPNEYRQHGKIDNKNKPWSSCYWEKGASEFLRESGYDTKPFVAPRWDVLGEDIYGSSPGMDGLGDAKMLQVREIQQAQAIDKHVDPPTQASPDLRNSGINALPGQTTFVNPNQGGSFITPIYQVQPDYRGALEDKQDIIGRIRDAYYTNLFLMLSQSDDPHLVPEVVRELRQEKMMALGPVLERLNNEFLDPIIDRVFNIMIGISQPLWNTQHAQKAQIPPPPLQLGGEPLRVEYISVLAQAQKALTVGTIQQVVQFVAGVAPAYPQALDKVDIDQAIDEVATDLGAPPSIVRSDDDVAAIRAQKAQQAQQQQMAAMAPAFAQYAQAAKNASQAQMTPGSLLGAAGAMVNAGMPPQ